MQPVYSFFGSSVCILLFPGVLLLTATAALHCDMSGLCLHHAPLAAQYPAARPEDVDDSPSPAEKSRQDLRKSFSVFFHDILKELAGVFAAVLVDGIIVPLAFPAAADYP